MNDPIPFATSTDWWDWLAANPDATEVWVLYHKKGGLPSIDWEQAVIGAISHGWIDGVRKSVNETQWCQRFSPRKAKSGWSAKNTRHAEKLIAEGRMTPAGMAHVAAAKADGRWDAAYSGGKNADLPEDFLHAVAQIPAAVEALKTLDARNRYAIYYRLKTARSPETRSKQLARFVALLAHGERLL